MKEPSIKNEKTWTMVSRAALIIGILASFVAIVQPFFSKKDVQNTTHGSNSHIVNTEDGNVNINSGAENQSDGQ